MTEHCLTAFFDVSYHQHSLLLKINVRNEQLSQRVSKLEYVVSKYIHVHASCGQDGLSNPFTWLRWIMSQTGYLKLLITRSILSSPLDFEIKRVPCNSPCSYEPWKAKIVPGTCTIKRWKGNDQNLCNRIPITFPVTITKVSNDYHRNIDVSLGFFTRFTTEILMSPLDSLPDSDSIRFWLSLSVRSLVPDKSGTRTEVSPGVIVLNWILYVQNCTTVQIANRAPTCSSEDWFPYNVPIKWV